MTSALVLSAALAAVTTAQVMVVVETEAGTIEVALDTKRAPATTANFLRYVDAGHYNGGEFHRTVKTQPDNQPQNTIRIDVIQGGVNPPRKAESFGPIGLERTNVTGLKHQDGAISMARFTADTAVSDFFICIGDQPSLDFGGMRNADGQGFAAFGRVTRGMDVVKKIQMSPADGQKLAPPVKILRIARQ